MSHLMGGLTPSGIDISSPLSDTIRIMVTIIVAKKNLEFH